MNYVSLHRNCHWRNCNVTNVISSIDPWCGDKGSLGGTRHKSGDSELSRCAKRHEVPPNPDIVCTS